MKSKILFALSICLFFFNCSSHLSKAVSDNSVENLHINQTEKAANKIAFLTFKMTLTDSIKNTYQFTLINSKFADGNLKSSVSNQVNIEPYTLYCEVTDDGNRRLDMLPVQNPLLKVLEYSPDKDLLEKKVFKRKAGELYLRFQLSKESKELIIYEPAADLKSLKKIYHVQI